jgi:hypothetical protein
MFIGAIFTLAGVIMQASSTTMEIFIGARVLSKLDTQKIIHRLNLFLSWHRHRFFYQCSSPAHHRT